ncbi:hypothetical protein HZB69_04675 [Candidatus Amesbacteria bacterium]|nr:hypothetical protein [Candidatus Amesbacteria bacterium]
MIEIKLANVCLAGGGYIKFDPKRLNADRVLCTNGGKWVEATIEGDRYVNKIGDVKVECAGCTLANPFFKILKKRIG